MSVINHIKSRLVVLYIEFCSRKFLFERVNRGARHQMKRVFKIVSATESKQYGRMQSEREKAIGKKYDEQKPLGFVRKRTHR